MIIDAYSFVTLPIEMDMIDEVKYDAFVLTFTDVAYYSWGPTIKGKVITLTWGGMPTAQYETFFTKYIADASNIFDPELGDARTFNVEIIRLIGQYHMSKLDSAPYRINCEMDLLITSVV
jgi:hypothetical protein